jgi:hypothetical protein
MPRGGGLITPEMFIFFLFAFAVDAQLGHRTGLETRHTYVFAAFVANAVGAFIHTRQGRANFFDKLEFTIPYAQRKSAIGFHSGPIRRVGAKLIVIRHIF